MFMVRILTIAILLLVNIMNVSGQSEGDQELSELLNSQVIGMDNLFIRNLSIISQVQNENYVILFQEQKGTVTNNATVLQDGLNNTGRIHQTGSALETLLWQLSFGNVADLSSTGENITVSVNQEGNCNRIDLTLMGDGLMDPFSEQRVEILQVGNAHELKAHMESFNMPLQIEQIAGPGGEGMKIDVSSSAFALP